MQESLISGSPLFVVIPFHIPELFSVFSIVYKSAVLYCGYVLTHLRVWGIKDLCLFQFLFVLCDCHQQQLQILWNFCIFQPS